MSYRVAWYIPGRILRIEVIGPLNLEDMVVAWEAGLELLDASATGKVHLLLDLVQRGEVMPDILQLREWLRFGTAFRTHLRSIVAVDPQPQATLQIAGQATIRMMGLRLYIAATLADAHVYWREIDPTLDLPDDDDL